MGTPSAAVAAPVQSLRHPLARALLGLTFTTGLVDAVSYLGLGRVFTANMTGNIVFLGFGIAGSGGLPVLAPIVSLVAFLVGAGAGELLAARLADRRPGLLRARTLARGRADRRRGLTQALAASRPERLRRGAAGRSTTISPGAFSSSQAMSPGEASLAAVAAANDEPVEALVRRAARAARGEACARVSMRASTGTPTPAARCSIVSSSGMRLVHLARERRVERQVHRERARGSRDERRALGAARAAARPSSARRESARPTNGNRIRFARGAMIRARAARRAGVSAPSRPAPARAATAG